LIDLHVKSLAYFERVITQAAKELYKSGDVPTFLSSMDDIIQREIPRAWYAGMRDCGIKPEDLTEEEQNELIDMMTSLSSFVPGLAGGITKLSDDGKPFESITSRLSLWVNRWNEAFTRGSFMCGDEKLEWHLGETEVHCESCLKLDGYVKRASQWKKYGIGPQGGPNGELPNPKLSCGGWKCDCRLVGTDKAVTKGRMPRLP
jgi:hypothetical protein